MLVSAVICILGAIFYLLLKDKPADLSKIAFGCGLLALLLQVDKFVTLISGILK